MKHFNLHTPQTYSSHTILIREYAIVISMFTILLSTYTFYEYYKLSLIQANPEIPQEAINELPRLQTSSLDQFMQILSLIPSTIAVGSLSITPKTIKIAGTTTKRTFLVPFLQEICQKNTVSQIKTQKDVRNKLYSFSLEIK